MQSEFPAYCKCRLGLWLATCWRMALGGDGTSIHDSRGRRAGTARDRDAAVSVSLHGARRQAARFTATGASNRPRRCGRGDDLLPSVPLIAGGKSFGGRMTSQAQAKAPLTGVRGWAFVGFPLHAAGHPSHDRAEHLSGVKVPMLFLQGTRDALASLGELEPLCKKLGKRATLKLLADADHSFHVPAQTGRTDADVLAEVLDCWRRGSQV